MSTLVPAEEIEQLVGARRHVYFHLGRADSYDQIVYVLHSQTCKDETPDLRDCAYSHFLDNGILAEQWAGHEDEVVVLAAVGNRLVPMDHTDGVLTGIELL